MKQLPPQYQEQLNRVKSDPQNADAWETLADLLAEAGDTQRAEKCYRKVLALRPDDLESRVSLERLRGNVNEEENSLISELENWHGFTIPLWFQVFLGLFSFLATLMLAVAQQWQVTDLVWSLWISSLVLGYGYLLTGIISRALRGVDGLEDTWGKALHALNAENKTPWPLIVLGALFVIAFFSVHFIMFHFVHSVFLNLFFPLYGDGTDFPRLLPVVGICIVRYWPVVLFSAITQLTSFLEVAESTGSNFLSMPYRNVVKMHISIFVFAGLSFTNISGLALYYVLILYFFPFGSLKTFLQGRKSLSTTT